MGISKRFTPEYKKEIIRLVTEQGKKVKDVAADIGVTETSGEILRTKLLPFTIFYLIYIYNTSSRTSN